MNCPYAKLDPVCLRKVLMYQDFSERVREVFPKKLKIDFSQLELDDSREHLFSSEEPSKQKALEEHDKALERRAKLEVKGIVFQVKLERSIYVW